MIRILSIITALFISQIAFSQKQAGDRVMSMQIDMAQGEQFLDAFKYADSACVSVIHMSFPWNEVEKDTNVWDFSRIDTMFLQAKSIPGLKIELNLPPLNMGWKTVPADLYSDSLNSFRTLNRFKAYIDTVFNHLEYVEIYTLNIGNEHGLYLLELWPDTSRIAQFKDFHKQMATYAKNKYATQYAGTELPVGTTITYASLVHTNTWWFMQQLNNELSDVISCNYYGINDDGTVKDTTEVLADFDSLLNLYGGKGKDILITECGYPSGDTCNSSEIKQKEFVETVFKAWDNYSDDIKYVSFFTLADWPWEIANFITNAMNIPEANKATFREYLRTLGCRDYTGEPKLSMKALIEESNKRCFCAAPLQLTTISDTSICKGDSVQLWANGGYHYKWWNESIEENIKVSPDTLSYYSIKITDKYACTSQEDSIKVNVIALPNAYAGKDSTITNGESIDITASGGDKYLWSNNDITATTTVAPTATSSYWVKVTNALGCYDYDTLEITVVPYVNPTKTKGNTTNPDILIYPNPATDYLNVEFYSASENIWMVEIIDINGKRFYVQQGSNRGITTLEVNINSFTRGIYTLSFWQNNKVISKNILVK